VFRINRRTDYATRVLLFLARKEDGERHPSAEIQCGALIPRAFMARIVAELAQAGLVTTYPGRDGGLTLSRPAEQISLRDMLLASEVPLRTSTCLDGGDKPSPLEAACPVRRCWGRLQVLILRELDQVRLADLAVEGAVGNQLGEGGAFGAQVPGQPAREFTFGLLAD